jgi:hypothetical protein
VVGLFEIQWQTPRHNILVEFMNNSKLVSKHNNFKVMMAQGQRIIDKHLLAEVFLICHISEIETD